MADRCCKLSVLYVFDLFDRKIQNKIELWLTEQRVKYVSRTKRALISP